MFTKTQIYPHEWIQLSQETRAKLADTFGIKKSGGVMVVDNKIISDGYSPTDLAELSTKVLQEFTNKPQEEDYVKLLNMAIDKINGVHVMPIEQVKGPEPVVEPLVEIKI